MSTFVGVDDKNVVRVIVDGHDASCVPILMNGQPLVARELSTAQVAQYAALPAKRGPAVFDGTSLTAQEAPKEPAPAATLDDVIAVLPQAQKDALDQRVKGK